MTVPTGSRNPAPVVGRVRAGAFDPALMVRSLPDAVRKLDPRHQVRYPVMFVVWVGSVLTTVLAVLHPSVFAWSVAVWLWATVVFANLAESVAEGRGRAQAASLRRARTTTMARRRRDGEADDVPVHLLRHRLQSQGREHLAARDFFVDTVMTDGRVLRDMSCRSRLVKETVTVWPNLLSTGP